MTKKTTRKRRRRRRRTKRWPRYVPRPLYSYMHSPTSQRAVLTSTNFFRRSLLTRSTHLLFSLAVLVASVLTTHRQRPLPKLASSLKRLPPTTTKRKVMPPTMTR